VIPEFVKNAWAGMKGEKRERVEVSPAVERRRWVEMRNYIVVSTATKANRTVTSSD
jgi:hypothetical protein